MLYPVIPDIDYKKEKLYVSENVNKECNLLTPSPIG